MSLNKSLHIGRHVICVLKNSRYVVARCYFVLMLMNDRTNERFSALWIFSDSLFHMLFNFPMWELYAWIIMHELRQVGSFNRIKAQKLHQHHERLVSRRRNKTCQLHVPIPQYWMSLDFRTITKITIKSRSTSSGFMCDQKFKRRAKADELSIVKAESLLHLRLILIVISLPHSRIRLVADLDVVDDAEENQNKR